MFSPRPLERPRLFPLCCASLTFRVQVFLFSPELWADDLEKISGCCPQQGPDEVVNRPQGPLSW